jgi:uncharacterized protein (DUF39 family)
MVKGVLKGMNPRYIRAVSVLGYGVSMAVGIGIPIPILNEDMAFFTGVSDADIQMPIKDYGHDYPNGIARNLGYLTYAELRSGEVLINGKPTQSVPVTSLSMSLEVATTLKSWIEQGKFQLTEPVEPIPSL